MHDCFLSYICGEEVGDGALAFFCGGWVGVRVGAALCAGSCSPLSLGKCVNAARSGWSCAPFQGIVV